MINELYPFIQVYALIIGLSVGSFLNVIIYRLPNKKSIVRPRSRCTNCRFQISWYDNIPLISYITLLGKCRNCKEKISIRYPLIELICGLMTLMLLSIYGPSWEFIVFVLLCYMLIAITFIDVDYFIIPNSFIIFGLIHNDYNDHNIILDSKNNFKGVIDFGDLVYTYLSAEPAICIAYAVLGSNDPFEVAANILKGFESFYHLSDEEIESVIYLSCMRLCISVIMANYRANLFPNNDYLMISNEEAWSFLEYMYTQDILKWSRDLVQYVRA